MKKFVAIISVILLIFSPFSAAADDVGISFGDYMYSVKVGSRTDLSGLVNTTGGESYDKEYKFIIYDDTFAEIDGNILITKQTGTVTVTAICYFSSEETSFDRYATCDIRIKKDGSLVRTADLNLDGVINSDDLSIILSEYMGGSEKCDLNGDWEVNSSDLSNLLHRYGQKL